MNAASAHFYSVLAAVREVLRGRTSDRRAFSHERRVLACIAAKSRIASELPMTTPRLRYSLLLALVPGALLLSIAHGCSDSSFECLGTPVACEDRDLSECIAGCRVFEGCVGGTVDCASLTDEPTLCVQTAGCRYLGSCDGPPGCSELSYDNCPSMEGCTQVRRCGGDGVQCGQLEDDLCELYPQCERGQECRGSATACGELESSSACLDVPGCLPADTTPAVIE